MTSATGATRKNVVESDASADESAKAKDPAAVMGWDAHDQLVWPDARVLRKQPQHADGECVASDEEKSDEPVAQSQLRPRLPAKSHEGDASGTSVPNDLD